LKKFTADRWWMVDVLINRANDPAVGKTVFFIFYFFSLLFTLPVPLRLISTADRVVQTGRAL
jgi:hypothetical protein